MKALQSRRVAALIAVVVVVLSLLLGGGRSLCAARANVYRADSTYAEDTASLRAIASNLCSVCSRYPTLAESDESLSTLQYLLKEEPDHLTEINSAFDRLLSLAAETTLSEKDTAYMADFTTDMKAIRSILSHSTYNERAQAYNAMLQTAFPARALAALFQIEPLEIF
ncbi:MAG: hypothetical protein LUG13_10225 [Oscillospiraceae bacterium]|nr:hypothetical protein [Oscillospiraceae bacterium]